MRCAGCLAFLALSVVWMVGQAIAGWELQYEDVQGRMLGEVHFVDEWHGWAIGMEGAILRTTNGGATWEHVDDPWGYGGWAIHFANAAEGWAAGGECGDPQPGYIMHTTDGGDTWELQIDKYDIPFTRFYGLHFVDNQNGWAVIGGKWGRVYHTTNGGAAWVEQTVPGHDYGTELRGVHFEDQWTGWVVGGLQWSGYGAGVIYRTTDGGFTWWQQYEISDTHLFDVWFTDHLNGWVVGGGLLACGALILHTEDGGDSWYQQYWDPIGPHMGSVCFVDDATGWATGAEYPWLSSTVLRTVDGGQTWAEDEGVGYWPLDKALNGVHFVDAMNGWGVGRDQRIVKYTPQSTLEFDDGQCFAELVDDQDGDGYHRRANLHFAVSELAPGKSADGYVEAWISPAGAGQYVLLGATQVFTASGYYTSSYPVSGDDLYALCGIDHGLWDFELRLFSSAGIPWDVTDGNGQLDGVPMETGAQDAPNQPPGAVFSVAPDSVETNEWVIADASECWDDKDPVDSLWVRWDWNGDGTYETGWSRGKVDSTFYPSLGTRSVVLEVRDTGGLCDTAAQAVWVLDLPPDPVPSLQVADVPGDQGGAIRLDWMLSGDDGENADDVTGYEVWRRQDGSAAYDTLSTAPAGAGAYVDTTAVDGVAYWYVVAVSDGQFTTASEEAGPVESLDDIAPLAPGGFDAELHPGAGAVLLTVQRSPDDGGGAGDVQFYRLAWGSGPTPPYTFLCDIDANAQNDYEHWDSLVVASHYAVWAWDGANESDTLVAAAQLDTEGRPLSRKLSLELEENPCRGVARALCTLPTAGDLIVGVYDLSGKLVAEVFRGHADAGTHAMRWTAGADTAGTRPGVYVWRVRSCRQVVTRRFVLVE